tara:strand:+ start:1365 stop:1508 length:144 start_codon:yes stop_codon:yes gene_type:complete
LLFLVFRCLIRAAFLFFKPGERTDDPQRNYFETIASFAKRFGAAAEV